MRTEQVEVVSECCQRNRSIAHRTIHNDLYLNPSLCGLSRHHPVYVAKAPGIVACKVHNASVKTGIILYLSCTIQSHQASFL